MNYCPKAYASGKYILINNIAYLKITLERIFGAFLASMTRWKRHGNCFFKTIGLSLFS